MQLFLDMDGVLMDFESHKTKWLKPWEKRQYHHLPKDQWTAEEKERDAELHKVMALDEFWTTMQPMRDAHLLWDWCRPLHPHVLTATPNGAHYRERCARDKMGSIHQFFDSVFPAEHFHAVLRSEKQQYAAGNVLVDDMPSNCAEWNAAGGTAILHKDAFSTIRILREIFGE